MTTWRKVLAWEIDEEPAGDDAEVPQKFTPIDPIDQQIYAMPAGNARDRALVDRLHQLHQASSVALFDFTAPYSQVEYGSVYIQARSWEEAELLLEANQWNDSEVHDYDNFEISGPLEQN